MERHPKAKQPVKVANGPYKGRYFLIEDFLVNQFQGKKIENLYKGTMKQYLTALEARGYPVDDQVVWGRIYPSMEWITLHDKELQVDMKVIEGEGEKVELPPNVEPLMVPNPKTKKKKGKKDDA